MDSRLIFLRRACGPKEGRRLNDEGTTRNVPGRKANPAYVGYVVRRASKKISVGLKHDDRTKTDTGRRDE
jgi:hypothetical protein